MYSDFKLLKGYPHFLVLAAVLQLFVFATGCSVREDRDSCPCVLSLDFSMNGPEMLEDGVKTFLHSHGDVSFFLSDTVHLPLWASAVPRTEMRVVSIWPADVPVDGPADGVPCHDAALVKIREGHDCPRVWMDAQTVSTLCETENADVALHKNYCELSVSVRNASGSGFPFRLELRGNIAGYDIDGNPMAGQFIVPVDGPVCVPRQVDNSLVMDVISENDEARTFAIGNYIEASGYDWTSPDLKDISMEIDYSETGLSFRIGPWKRTVEFEVMI